MFSAIPGTSQVSYNKKLILVTAFLDVCSYMPPNRLKFQMPKTHPILFPVQPLSVRSCKLESRESFFFSFLSSYPMLINFQIYYFYLIDIAWICVRIHSFSVCLFFVYFANVSFSIWPSISVFLKNCPTPSFPIYTIQ